MTGRTYLVVVEIDGQTGAQYFDSPAEVGEAVADLHLHRDSPVWLKVVSAEQRERFEAKDRLTPLDVAGMGDTTPLEEAAVEAAYERAINRRLERGDAHSKGGES